MLELEVYEDEEGQPLNRAKFNEQQLVEGGLEKEGYYGSYDQMRMLGSDLATGGYLSSPREESLNLLERLRSWIWDN